MSQDRPSPPAPGDPTRELEFWHWLRIVGLCSLCDTWLLLHVILGAILGTVVRDPLSKIALTVFLPFASVLVGLAFAWGGNAMAVLQSPELHEIGNQGATPDAYRNWVFSYQLAILVILTALVLWALAALGVSDDIYRLAPQYWRVAGRMAGRTAAFAFSSIAIRESWNVVLGAQAMLLAQNRIRLEKGAQDEHPH